MARYLTIAQKVGNRPALDVLYPSSGNSTAEDPEIEYVSRSNSSYVYHTDAFESIVAVHGLGSNVDWSWTWKDDTQLVNGKPRLVNWLSDEGMLPAKVSRARILAYNYESRWHMNAATTRLQVCGKHLADAIHEFREDCSDRPLIFIGHSLGGNVIQHVSGICAGSEASANEIRTLLGSFVRRDRAKLEIPSRAHSWSHLSGMPFQRLEDPTVGLCGNSVFEGGWF